MVLKWLILALIFVRSIQVFGTSLCSLSLEGGEKTAEEAFVEVVLNLHESGTIQLDEVEMIARSPLQVLDIIGEYSTLSLVPYVPVLEMLIHLELDEGLITDQLIRSMRLRKDKEERQEEDRVQSRPILGFLPIRHSRPILLRDMSLNGVEWLGENRMVGVGQKAPGDGIQKKEVRSDDALIVFDPVTGEISKSFSPSFNGARRLTGVLDSVSIGSETFLLIGLSDDVQTNESYQPHYLLIYHLNRGEVVDAIELGLGKAPLVFKMYRNEGKFIVYGRLLGERNLVIFNSENGFKKQEIPMNLDIDTVSGPFRYEHLKNGTFFRDGELHLAIHTLDVFKVVNIERGELVAEASFKSIQSGPFVVEIAFNKHIVFLSGGENSEFVYVFDPMNPKRKFRVEGIRRMFEFSEPAVVSFDEKKELVWATPMGLVKLDLKEENLNSLFLEREESFFKIAFEKLQEWAERLGGLGGVLKVSSASELTIDLGSEVLEEDFKAGLVRVFEFRGKPVLVVNFNVEKPFSSGLSLVSLDEEEGHLILDCISNEVPNRSIAVRFDQGNSAYFVQMKPRPHTIYNEVCTTQVVGARELKK